jgi:CRP/FNR family transcriptional regulator
MKRQRSQIQNCETCTFRTKAVVCDLEGAELSAFQKIKRSLHYEPNQTVFYEGHSCLGLYLLCAGKVKLTRSSPRGQRQIVRILDGGELIEKYAFRDNAIHDVTCETLEPSQICLIEKEPFLALAQRTPELAIKLVKLLSCELGENLDQLDEFAFKSARERLATLLLDLAERFGGRATDGLQIGLKLKREEIAEMAGITVETAIRLLSAFRDEGLVALDGRAITLLNQDRLARIARR